MSGFSHGFSSGFTRTHEGLVAFTRLGMSGFPRGLYGSFAGKVETVLADVLGDICLNATDARIVALDATDARIASLSATQAINTGLSGTDARTVKLKGVVTSC